MPVAGRTKGLSRRKWLDFGDTAACKKSCGGMLTSRFRAVDVSIGTIHRSTYPKRKSTNTKT